VPQGVTTAQLETLLNGLLQNDEKMPYSFYLDDQVGLWLDETR
jgi:ribosome assembly protein 4